MQTCHGNQRCWYQHLWTLEAETPVQGSNMVRHMWPPPELFHWTDYSNTWSTTQMSHRYRNFVDRPLSIELDPRPPCWFLFCKQFHHLGMQLETHIWRWHWCMHNSPRTAYCHKSRNAVESRKDLLYTWILSAESAVNRCASCLLIFQLRWFRLAKTHLKTIPSKLKFVNWWNNEHY